MSAIVDRIEGGVVIDSGEESLGHYWAQREADADVDFFDATGRVIRVLRDGRGPRSGWVSAATGQALDVVVAEGEE